MGIPLERLKTVGTDQCPTLHYTDISRYKYAEFVCPILHMIGGVTYDAVSLSRF